MQRETRAVFRLKLRFLLGNSRNQPAWNGNEGPKGVGRGVSPNSGRRRRKEALTFLASFRWTIKFESPNLGCHSYGSRSLRFRSLWRQAVTFTSISAFILAGIGNVDAAPVYTPVFYFYSTDYLGSSNILTDRSGNLVQQYEYTTFGQTAYQNNSSAFPVSNRYTGQIADDETGLYYYGGRYYDPQLGRFIQPDPEIPDPTDSQSYNRYSYCGNNPLNETDPSGFDPALGGDAGNDNNNSDDGGIFIGDSGWGYLSAGPNGIPTGNWIPWNNPITPFDIDSVNELFNQDISAQQESFDSLGNAFSGFNDIPNASTTSELNSYSASGNSGKWLNGINAALTVASLAPGLAGSVASAAQAGLDLVQGHYFDAGLDATGIALSFVGLGVAVKAIKLAREVRLAKNAEALTADAAKVEASSSKALGRNLEEAGIVRPQDTAAHHIVAGNDPRAAEARAILNREGIGINDAENGVFLPRNSRVPNPTGAQIHSTVHTDVYFNNVNAALRNAPPGTARDVLQDIANQLQEGTFPH